MKACILQFLYVTGTDTTLLCTEIWQVITMKHIILLFLEFIDSKWKLACLYPECAIPVFSNDMAYYISWIYIPKLSSHTLSYSQVKTNWSTVETSLGFGHVRTSNLFRGCGPKLSSSSTSASTLDSLLIAILIYWNVMFICKKKCVALVQLMKQTGVEENDGQSMCYKVN